MDTQVSNSLPVTYYGDIYGIITQRNSCLGLEHKRHAPPVVPEKNAAKVASHAANVSSEEPFAQLLVRYQNRINIA